MKSPLRSADSALTTPIGKCLFPFLLPSLGLVVSLHIESLSRRFLLIMALNSPSSVSVGIGFRFFQRTFLSGTLIGVPTGLGELKRGIMDDTITDIAGEQKSVASEDGGFGLGEEEETVGADARRKTLSLEERTYRDEMLIQSVKHLRMTAPQILEFSKSWGVPFCDVSRVRRRIDALKLRGRVKRVAEQNYHDQWVLKTFIKICQDATLGGHKVEGIAKEFRIGDNSRIRADMRFEINQRLFFLETQVSSLTYRSWKDKLRKYVRYRKSVKIPFRVLVVFDDRRHLSTVFRQAQEVMKEYEKQKGGGRPLELFLFAWGADLLGQFDTVSLPCWVSNLDENRSLVE